MLFLGFGLGGSMIFLLLCISKVKVFLVLVLYEVGLGFLYVEELVNVSCCVIINCINL